jgi:hypothetical protein
MNIVLRNIRFNIIVVGFDLVVVEVRDIAIGVLNVGYFVKVTLYG